MRKTIIFLLNLCLFFSLCACSGSNTTYTVHKGEKTFEVNLENGTIFDGTYTYEYDFSGDSSSYRINITYPNGSTYYWSRSGYFGHGGWSDDYDENRYVDGDTLRDVITEKAPKASEPFDPGKMLAIILLIGIGAFNAAVPNAAWYLEHGWRYKDAEPSDLALVIHRFGGIIAVIAGVFMIFV